MKLCLLAVVCFSFHVAVAQSPRILVPYRVGNKWGYADTLGRIKIQPKYDSASLFDYDAEKKGDVVAIVLLNGKQMVINDKGEVLVPAKYDQIGFIHTLEDFAFVVYKQGKGGIVTKGKEVIPPVYDQLFMEEGNYFEVRKNGKYSLFNPQGKLVISVSNEPIFESGRKGDSIIMFASENGALKSYMLKLGKQYFYSASMPAQVEILDAGLPQEQLDTIIEIAKKEYRLDSVRFKNAAAIIYKNETQGILLPLEKKKVYFFSKQYTIHQIKYFSANRGTTWNKGAAYIIVSLNNKYGIVNELEKQILPFKYDDIEEQDGFFLLKQNGKSGFFITNTLYPAIKPAYDKYIGKKLIPVNYQWDFTLFEVIKNGKRGFVGENGVAYFKE